MNRRNIGNRGNESMNTGRGSVHLLPRTHSDRVPSVPGVASDTAVTAVTDVTREQGTMTYFEWLQTKAQRDSPRGDLARDAAYDPRFPRDVSSRAALLNYLARYGACDEALRVANRSWSAYARALRQAEGQGVGRISGASGGRPSGAPSANARDFFDFRNSEVKHDE